MPNQHIEINQAVRLGAVLFNAVSGLQPTLDKFANVKAIMDQVAVGGDWAAIEAQFGVPSGNGEIVYNLVTACNNALHTVEIETVTERLG